MGLYSTNKVAAVAESGAVVDENAEFIKEIEECAFDPNFGDIMEAAIQLHENDKRMFDALIECDFMSAVNESVMLEADAETANEAGNEKKKGKIMEMIDKIITAVMEAVKKAAANIIYKITDLVKGDKKLYDAYSKHLTMDNLKGFPGIADFAFPKATIDKDSLKSVENAKAFAAEFNQKVARAEEKDIIDSAYEDFQKKVEDEKQSYSKLADGETYFEAKEKSWKPTADWQLKKMLNVMASGSETIKEIKNHTAQVMGALKALRNEAKAAAKSGKKAGEVEVYKLNKIYTAASQTCNVFSKEFKAYTVLAMKQIAACRKAAILCGRYASKTAKGEAKAEEPEVLKGDAVIDKDGSEIKLKEAMIMWALGESSDTYVEECLGYC